MRTMDLIRTHLGSLNICAGNAPYQEKQKQNHKCLIFSLLSPHPLSLWVFVFVVAILSYVDMLFLLPCFQAEVQLKSSEKYLTYVGIAIDVATHSVLSVSLGMAVIYLCFRWLR